MPYGADGVCAGQPGAPVAATSTQARVHAAREVLRCRVRAEQPGPAVQPRFAGEVEDERQLASVCGAEAAVGGGGAVAERVDVGAAGGEPRVGVGHACRPVPEQRVAERFRAPPPGDTPRRGRTRPVAGASAANRRPTDQSSLSNVLTFSDGSTSRSGAIPQGAAAAYSIVVPSN